MDWERDADCLANWTLSVLLLRRRSRRTEHVHVERDDRVAKFWLDPVRLQRSGGFGSSELNRIQKLVEDNRGDLIRSWNEYFSR